MNGRTIFLYTSLWAEHGGAPGIGLFSFDIETGAIKLIEKLNDTISCNGSYLDQKRGILYVCNETDFVDDAQYSTGRIYGFKIDPVTGKLDEIFHRNTFCPFPSYVNISRDGQYMVVAHHGSSVHAPVFSTHIEQDENGDYYPVMNFDDAVVQLYEIQPDGIPGRLLHVEKHTSDIPLFTPRGKLNSCHPHSAVISPSGNLIAVCDKGDSYLYLYKIDKAQNKLVRLNRTITSVKGCASRYVVFHPTRPYLFVNHEAMYKGRMAVCTLKYDEDGNMEKICDVNALPEDHQIIEGIHYEQQGLAMTPDGKHLYTILNGPNMIEVLDLDEFADVSEEQWNDWHWQVKNRAETIEDLKKYMTLTPDEEDGIKKTLGKLRMAVTP